MHILELYNFIIGLVVALVSEIIKSCTRSLSFVIVRAKADAIWTILTSTSNDIFLFFSFTSNSNFDFSDL